MGRALILLFLLLAGCASQPSMYGRKEFLGTVKGEVER